MNETDTATRPPPWGRRFRKILLGLGCGVVLFVIGFFVLAWWAMYTLPVSQADLDKVRVGMSESKVRTILGEPDSVDSWEAGETWRYADWRWAMVDLHFDAKGAVESVEVDW